VEKDLCIGAIVVVELDIPAVQLAARDDAELAKMDQPVVDHRTRCPLSIGAIAAVLSLGTIV
jgi:hypothetical protein